jgi:hypothetical protein
MTSRADEPYLGETRAERRRRLQAEQWHGAQPPAAAAPEPWAPALTGPYDPRPYGVRAYPDIEDAVLAEYVEEPPAPTSDRAQPEPMPASESVATPAAPDVPALPFPDADDALPADPDPGPTTSEPPVPAGSPGADSADAPRPDRRDPGPGGESGPSRHVAHRAYGGAPQTDDPPVAPFGAAGGAAPTPALPSTPTPGDAPAPAGAPIAARIPATPDAPDSSTGAKSTTGAASMTSAASAASATGAKPADPPLAELVDDEDPAAAAARLQLLAAQAAAERLARPRKAIGQSAASPATRADRERRAAEKIAADKVAAARLAAVRAAAEQRESSAVRAARLAAQTNRGPLGTDATSSLAAAPATSPRTPPAAPAVPSVPSSASPTSSTSTPSSRKAPPGAAGRPQHDGRASHPKQPRKVTPRWAKVAYAGGALAVVAGGLALTVPTVGALLTQAPPAPATTPTAAASSSAASPTTSGTAAASETPGATGPSAASAAMACDPAQWTDQVTGEAPEVFTASGVAQAYCLTGGTVRDIGFTDLAAKKTGYTTNDFAFVAPYLSPALKTQWDKDVAELVKSQDIAGASGRRISALTTLAWGDRDGLKFDPAASARATDFAVGKPVTWVVKGSDGVNRLGMGFETGLITHMVDGAGRRQDRILKRTYKLLLVKGDAEHPWLIDAYEIGQSMAGLSTTTVAPTATGSAPATPTSRATR